MNCAVSKDQLWAFALGVLDDESAVAELQTHIASCTTCQSRLSEMQGLAADLDELGTLDFPPEAFQYGGAALAPGVPETIGRFRVLRKLGEGGMGVVFEAEQPQPRRRVALKVIRGARFADEYHVKLFRREMQTLAHLNHSAIASIYEAGVTEEGLHYYAMELVDGVPLHAWCEGERPGDAPRAAPLSMRDRLKLFHEICAAISYAHQRGVMHRDLKPANILVTAAGQPKVLDFGLARALDEAAGPEEFTAVTKSGTVVGTLSYMSPEQARGDTAAIDVRTDVYALGVILYELLAGRRPHDTHGLPMHESVRMICEQTPRDPRAINQGVPREPALIALKSLEKDLDRRYQNVAELAGDIERFLTDHPIRARPPSAFYRARKWLRRNRVFAGLAGIIVLGSISAAAIFASQSRTIARQRDRAVREANKFERINDVLTGLLISSNPWAAGDRDTRVVDVLDTFARRIETELSDTPLVAAAVRNTLGNTYRAFSEYDKAERHLRYAVRTRRKLLGERHLDTLASINDLGELLYEAGNLDAAEPLLREALTGRRARLPQYDPDLASTINSVGLIAQRKGNLADARELLTDALARRTAIAGRVDAEDAPTAERTAAWADVAQTTNNLAVVYRAMANDGSADADATLDKAEALYRRALALRAQWLGENHPDTAKMHNNLGRLLLDRDKPGAAVEQFTRALDTLLAELGELHRFTARARYNLALALVELGDLDAARDQLDRALRTQTAILPPDDRHRRQTEQLLADLSHGPEN